MLGPMVLGNMDVGLNTQNLVAILVVVTLSVINIFGVKTGALIQNVFTVCQGLGTAGTGAASEFCGTQRAGNSRKFSAATSGITPDLDSTARRSAAGVFVSTLTVLAVAQVGSLFSADAWNNVTFTAGEVKNPSRNLPLSLALGTGVVIALYIACNFIYPERVCHLMAIRPGATILDRGIKYAAEDRVGTAVMTQMFGAAGGALMAIAIMISSFGCCNGLILGRRPRLLRHGQGRAVLSAASRKLHPTYKTPVQCR
mgnify:CR=1 FL=1